MPKDAPLNSGALPGPDLLDPFGKVSEMQAKLHRWAVADSGRRFDDLFNFVCDPATLIVAFARVAGNRGARSPGVDGLGRWLPITADGIELRSIAAIPVTRYRYRGNTIPNPWVRQTI